MTNWNHHIFHLQTWQRICDLKTLPDLTFPPDSCRAFAQLNPIPLYCECVHRSRTPRAEGPEATVAVLGSRALPQEPRPARTAPRPRVRTPRGAAVPGAEPGALTLGFGRGSRSGSGESGRSAHVRPPGTCSLRAAHEQRRRGAIGHLGPPRTERGTPLPPPPGPGAGAARQPPRLPPRPPRRRLPPPPPPRRSEHPSSPLRLS